MSDDQYGDYSRRGDYEGQDPYGQDPYAGRRGYRTRGSDPSYPARGEEAYPPASGGAADGGRGDTAYPRSYGRDYSGRGDYPAADGAAGAPDDGYHTGGYASGYPGGADYAGQEYPNPREQRSYRRGEYRPRGEYGRRGDPYGGDTRSRRDVLGVIASSLFAVLAVLALVTVLYLIFKPDDDPGTPASETTDQPTGASQDPSGESTDEATAPADVKAPVVVLNATGINGLAGQVTEEIGAAEWETQEPGNYEEGVVEETTVFYPTEEFRPAAEALMEAFPNITAIEQGDETMAQDALTVVLAAEWD